MKTKKIWTDNLKNGVVTEEMLSLCLHSVNKRAKNYRDKAREYNDYYRNMYSSGAQEKKEEMYNYKTQLLQYIKPKCIHCVKSIGKERKYSYESDFNKILDDDVIYQGSFICDEYGDVDFKDVYADFYENYLYYEINEFGFHQPIEDEDPELEIIRINDLTTFGKDITDLVSMQFVKKVLETLKTYSNKIKILAT
jgi:hypothetical protein